MTNGENHFGWVQTGSDALLRNGWNTESFGAARWLQNGDSSSNTEIFQSSALFLAYLCVLTCCCITPCVYYIRISALHRRHIRHLRELERAGMLTALAQSSSGMYIGNNRNTSSMLEAMNSQPQHPNGESEAVRAERQALILQLLAPCRMTLTEEHFPKVIPPPRITHPELAIHCHSESSIVKQIEDVESSSSGPVTPTRSSKLWNKQQHTSIKESTTLILPDDTLSDATSSVCSTDDKPIETLSQTSHRPSEQEQQRTQPQKSTNFDYDEESILIQIPLPGLVLKQVNCRTSSERDEETPSPPDSTTWMASTATARVDTSRLVPGFCTICLSGFIVGSDICWSSNSQCEHCFHCDCIEEWLTKQLQYGTTTSPICPCCRRDFIVDPHDFTMPVSSPTDPQLFTSVVTSDLIVTPIGRISNDIGDVEEALSPNETMVSASFRELSNESSFIEISGVGIEIDDSSSAPMLQVSSGDVERRNSEFNQINATNDPIDVATALNQDGRSYPECITP